MVFEIYTHKFEIDGQEYRLKPLLGKHIDKFYKVLGAFEGIGDGDTKVSNLPSEAMQDVHELLVESFKMAYPDKKEEEIDGFVTQNLLQLFEPLLKANMKQVDEKA